jgi:3'-phosphoadenosine 5'-phosphosulfate sulfotransferase (PAPS reductase)/FAD synthetase
LTYQEKIDSAKALIVRTLIKAHNPAVMCSFGKDSMVVLHLVMSIRKLKVIFHRELLQHHRHEYANRVMREWDLHVIDYPPASTAVVENDKEFNVVSYYQAGKGLIYLPTGTVYEDRGPDTVCALSDLYGKPTGGMAYPFDAVFHGHKTTDSDPVIGDVPLHADIASAVDAPSSVFVIRHFTDDDVWRYIEENNIPIHTDRYEKVDGKWRNKADRTNNPDYIACCYACMSKKTGNNVYCPKFGAVVSNISDRLRWAPETSLSYLKR